MSSRERSLEPSSAVSIRADPRPDDRVILEVNARYLRAGLSGETGPRVQLSADWKHDFYHAFWDQNDMDVFLTCDKLELAFRNVWNNYLLVDGKSRRVVLVDDPLLPGPFRNCICYVLFTYLQVPSITLMSLPLCAVFGSGLASGLVVDMAWSEITVTPVYLMIPLHVYGRASNIGGEMWTQLHGKSRDFAEIQSDLEQVEDFDFWLDPPSEIDQLSIPALIRDVLENVSMDLVRPLRQRVIFVGQLAKNMGLIFAIMTALGNKYRAIESEGCWEGASIFAAIHGVGKTQLERDSWTWSRE